MPPSYPGKRNVDPWQKFLSLRHVWEIETHKTGLHRDNKPLSHVMNCHVLCNWQLADLKLWHYAYAKYCFTGYTRCQYAAEGVSLGYVLAWNPVCNSAMFKTWQYGRHTFIFCIHSTVVVINRLSGQFLSFSNSRSPKLTILALCHVNCSIMMQLSLGSQAWAVAMVVSAICKPSTH